MKAFLIASLVLYTIAAAAMIVRMIHCDYPRKPEYPLGFDAAHTIICVGFIMWIVMLLRDSWRP